MEKNKLELGLNLGEDLWDDMKTGDGDFICKLIKDNAEVELAKVNRVVDWSKKQELKLVLDTKPSKENNNG